MCSKQLGKEGLPKRLSGKESACQAGDVGLIPEAEGSPGEENGNPLQYSFLENPMDRGAWRAVVQGVASSQTQLSRPNSNSNLGGKR